jgi:hypothetical protein
MKNKEPTKDKDKEEERKKNMEFVRKMFSVM